MSNTNEKIVFGALQIYIIAIIAFLVGGLLLIYYENAYVTVYWLFGMAVIFCTPRRWISTCKAVVLPAWWELSRPKTVRLIHVVGLSTLFFTIAIHGFLFANEFFSHDSLITIYNQYDILPFYSGVGRFLIPIYETIKGEAVSPWIVGLLFLLWMTLANLFVVKLLNINSIVRQVLVCGLMCSNVTLSLTGATYIYCMDEYALALLLAVLAAYFFCRCNYGEGIGVLCLVLSLSMYQAYFTVTLVLCYLVAIQRLLRGQTTGNVVKQGVKNIILMACAFMLYFVFWTAVCTVLTIEKARLGETLLSSGLTELWSTIYQSASEYIIYITTESGHFFGILFPAVNFLLLIILCVQLFGWLRRKEVHISKKIVLITLIACAPIVFNAASILLAGNASYLTHFGRALIYLLILMVVELKFSFIKDFKSSRLPIVAGLLICLVIWQNTVFANQIYMKKEIEKSSTISMITRMIERVEQMDGYVPGETSVAFVGNLSMNLYLNRGRVGFEKIVFLPGLGSDNAVTYTSTIITYITTYLNYPLLVVDGTAYSAMEQVQKMPSFPEPDSIAMIDGTVVVKLSELSM